MVTFYINYMPTIGGDDNTDFQLFWPKKHIVCILYIFWLSQI